MTQFLTLHHVLNTISHSEFQLGGNACNFCEGDRGSCEDIGGEIVRGVLDKHIFLKK
jgi:hypothetical protein